MVMKYDFDGLYMEESRPDQYGGYYYMTKLSQKGFFSFIKSLVFKGA